MVNLKREGGKTGETPPAKNPAAAGKKYPVLDISQQGLQQMMGPVQRNLEEFGFEATTMLSEEEVQYRMGRQQRLENLKRSLEPHLTGNPGFNANTLERFIRSLGADPLSPTSEKTWTGSWCQMNTNDSYFSLFLIYE